MPDHPELDILNVLMEDLDEVEDTHTSVLQVERERKRKERNKRKMLKVGLPTTSVAPGFKLTSRRTAPTCTLEKTIN